MFIFLNYNVSQAGHWPWATEQPPGKSSSLSLPREFPSSGLPARLLPRNPIFQRVPQALERDESRILRGLQGYSIPQTSRRRDYKSQQHPRAPLRKRSRASPPLPPPPTANCSCRSVPVFPPSVLMPPSVPAAPPTHR